MIFHQKFHQQNPIEFFKYYNPILTRKKDFCFHKTNLFPKEITRQYAHRDGASEPAPSPLVCLTRSRASGVTMTPNTRRTVFSTRVTQCMRDV